MSNLGTLPSEQCRARELGRAWCFEISGFVPVRGHVRVCLNSPWVQMMLSIEGGSVYSLELSRQKFSGLFLNLGAEESFDWLFGLVWFSF